MEVFIVFGSTVAYALLKVYFGSQQPSSQLPQFIQDVKYENLKTIGIILGTAIGDAKGIPYETLTYEQCLPLIPSAMQSTFEKCSPDNR
jgi:hypothetical protein